MSLDEEFERIKKRRFKELLRRSLSGRGGSSKAKIIDINDLTFEDAVNDYERLIVDFWAPWCTPCRILEPVLHELAEVYAGKITFGRLNVDENPRTAARFNVMSIPTLIMFENGVEVNRLVGALPKIYIENRIRRVYRL